MQLLSQILADLLGHGSTDFSDVTPTRATREFHPLCFSQQFITCSCLKGLLATLRILFVFLGSCKITIASS